MKGHDKMSTPSEVWKRVPGTSGLHLVSNLGHLIRVLPEVDKKTGGLEPRIVDKTKKLWCSLRGARLGWFLFVDEDHERFFERDRLMQLFDGIPIEVDTSRDAAAQELRRETILYCEAEIATHDECDVAYDRL